ncbi:MAG: hypothetical protein H7257_09270 [Taibaiella sp.]|nr:hypothetical protein [Taibaiella sp.]
MSTRHLVFIINQKAGVNRNKEIKTAVDAWIDSALYTTEIKYTTHAGHGTMLAREAAAAGAYAVAAVGGDGSVNDVAQGLLGTRTHLAIIPKGSGNGLARSLGIPLKTPAAIKALNKGHVEMTDVAFANNMPFISNAGVAFDALIAHKFAGSKRRGLLAYGWLVSKHLWLYKARHYEITADGALRSEKAFMVVVANGRQFGYNFKIAPMASHTDGLLDVIIIRPFPKMAGLLISLRAVMGTIAKSRYVTHFKCKELTITHPKLEYMQKDGDARKCGTHLKFTVQKAVLGIIVPE